MQCMSSLPSATQLQVPDSSHTTNGFRQMLCEGIAHACWCTHSPACMATASWASRAWMCVHAAVGIVYFAEQLNRLGAVHWERFATQNYFDPRGVFITAVVSGPLLLIMFIVLVRHSQTPLLANALLLFGAPQGLADLISSRTTWEGLHGLALVLRAPCVIGGIVHEPAWAVIVLCKMLQVYLCRVCPYPVSCCFWAVCRSITCWLAAACLYRLKGAN